MFLIITNDVCVNCLIRIQLNRKGSEGCIQNHCFDYVEDIRCHSASSTYCCFILTVLFLAEVHMQVYLKNDTKIAIHSTTLATHPLLCLSIQLNTAGFMPVHENSNLEQAWKKATCTAPNYQNTWTCTYSSFVPVQK